MLKFEGANLKTMTTILKLIVSCEALCVMISFQRSCFWHAFFKACQHVIFKGKVSKGLKYISIKFAQVLVKMYYMA